MKDEAARREYEPDWTLYPDRPDMRRNVWMAVWRIYWVSMGNPYPGDDNEYTDRADALKSEVFNLDAFLSPVRNAGNAPQPENLFYNSERFERWTKEQS